MPEKPKIAVLVSSQMKKNCIADEDFQRLKNFSEVIFEESSSVSYDLMLKLMKDTDGCLTGWGTPPFDKRILDVAPQLKIIAHSAGSIKPMLEKVREEIKKKKIVVTNATTSLGIGVAEFALGVMLMTMKRAWWFKESTKEGKWRTVEEEKKACEPYNATIGIIGASRVGRHLIKLLKQFDLKKILVFDPYLSNEEANKLGVEKTSLEELMSSSDVVSLHAPSTAETKGMVNKNNLKLMKDGAIFINTARGAIVNEKDLIEELKTGRITACIDVTDPEPPSLDNPLRTLPNVVLTPHIAGAIAQNRLRNGKYAIDELERFFNKEGILYPVNLEMWDQLA